MTMTKTSLAGALALAAVVTTFGCQGQTEDIEMRVSALGGNPGNVVLTPVRGHTFGNKHVGVFRGTGGGAAIGRVSGSPFFDQTRGWNGSFLFDSTPWGYVRGDGAEAILYLGADRHVREISSATGLEGSPGTTLDYFQPPVNAPLAAPAPGTPGGGVGPVPDVIGYVRSDGKTAVVYRSANDHVQQILRDPSSGAWTVTDLTDASGAHVNANKGSAFPYVRTDGVTTIVYVGSDNHIHELAFFGGGSGEDTESWADYDLSVATGDFVAPSSDPWAYKRSDGFNSILYVGTDNKIHELAYKPNVTLWVSYDFPAVSPKTGLYQRPTAYVRTDTINSVVYLRTDNTLHDVTLSGGTWTDFTLPVPAGVTPKGQAFGHTTVANWNAVLFHGTTAADGKTHGYALRLNPFAGAGAGWMAETIF